MSILAQYYTARDTAQRVASGGVSPEEAAGGAPGTSALADLTPLAIQALQTRRSMKKQGMAAEQAQDVSDLTSSRLDEMVNLNQAPNSGE